MKPSKSQYIETIKSGDDLQYRKNVVLNFDGTFEIVYNLSADSIFDYIGRSEPFDYNRGYVGIGAADDKNYINRSYAMFLKAWTAYIESGVHGRYLEVYPADNECTAIENEADTVSMKSADKMAELADEWRKYYDDYMEKLSQAFNK
jgi:hypothetical protein